MNLSLTAQNNRTDLMESMTKLLQAQTQAAAVKALPCTIVINRKLKVHEDDSFDRWIELF